MDGSSETPGAPPEFGPDGVPLPPCRFIAVLHSGDHSHAGQAISPAAVKSMPPFRGKPCLLSPLPAAAKPG